MTWDAEVVCEGCGAVLRQWRGLNECSVKDAHEEWERLAKYGMDQHTIDVCTAFAPVWRKCASREVAA